MFTAEMVPGLIGVKHFSYWGHMCSYMGLTPKFGLQLRCFDDWTTIVDIKGRHQGPHP